jgi:methylenetetrahydrofolate dehydrogenase (NADP+)/methenyltetrahydrofolate cyclohydrolase
MQNKIIDGNFQSKILRDKIASDVLKINIRPKLSIVLVGNNPVSHIYVKIKTKRAQEVGIETELHIFDEKITNDELLKFIDFLNQDESIHGILVQMPLPKHINKNAVLLSISPQKDVDGFSPVSVGNLHNQNATFVPCTPLGIIHLIKSVKKDLTGMRATVIGRSNIVGRPVAELLLQSDCSTTIVHSKSNDIARICRESDILIAAVGIPNLVTKDYIKPGAIVIDVGINKIGDKIIGDVYFDDVIDIVGHITPVPGGVGPMTVAYLLSNTMRAVNLFTNSYA